MKITRDLFSNIMRKMTFPAILGYLILCAQVRAQTVTQYRVVIDREDGRSIVFNMESRTEKGKIIWVIRNASERIRVDSIVKQGDSLFAEMPFFDSRLRVEVSAGQEMTGKWIRGTSAGGYSDLPVKATPGESFRFPALKGNAGKNITGRYAVEFIRADGVKRKSVAEFTQQKNKVTGTFLNPSGDYRFLEGIVTGDSLMLSCFDGGHAYFFGARVGEYGQLENGIYCSGLKGFETWTATKDEKASIEETGSMIYLREGEERLHFRLPDMDSNLVSIRDEKYSGKVVVVQLMGSWCPNCMDETAFLSEYYRKNRQRGVEVIALAYEYTTDFHKAGITLGKLQKRYQVEYPMLFTGVTTSDSLRTEKTLPELTPIKGFPTTIFIGKDGKVKEIHPGFSGPGTGKHHEEYIREFEMRVNGLLNEK